LPFLWIDCELWALQQRRTWRTVGAKHWPPGVALPEVLATPQHSLALLLSGTRPLRSRHACRAGLT